MLSEVGANVAASVFELDWYFPLFSLLSKYFEKTLMAKCIIMAAASRTVLIALLAYVTKVWKKMEKQIIADF